MNTAYLIYLANYSDGVLYVLAGLLVVALGVIVDRFWYLRRTILRGSLFVREIAQHGPLDRETLQSLADEAGDLPEAALLKTAVIHSGYVQGDALASRLEESILIMAPQLDRRLWVLDTIITLAPLLGLLGTIIGMFHAFSVLAAPGHAPTAVTGGVADALVTTATGLFIAIVGLIAFNAFNSQVRQILLAMDSVKTMLLNRMDGHLMPDNRENLLRAVAPKMASAVARAG
ncbi:MAG: MotA/TolQ/ExbB proton channel family protein [Acidithiobacillus sp.]|nr:MotA/TolQ/ExbB proton channel family protein [Acidithiobacillus sp.]